MRNTPFQDLDLSPLDELDYTHIFNSTKRKALYFGKYSYSYSNVTHPALPMTANLFINNIYNTISTLLPQFPTNSVLVHLYPSLRSGIPFHSDDEPGISPNSYIVTLSLGATRYLKFRKIGHTATFDSCIMRHGDIIIMSQSSQKIFEHGILQESVMISDQIIDTCRYSLTFRQMRSLA